MARSTLTVAARSERQIHTAPPGGGTARPDDDEVPSRHGEDVAEEQRVQVAPHVRERRPAPLGPGGRGSRAPRVVETMNSCT